MQKQNPLLRIWGWGKDEHGRLALVQQWKPSDRKGFMQTLCLEGKKPSAGSWKRKLLKNYAGRSRGHVCMSPGCDPFRFIPGKRHWSLEPASAEIRESCAAGLRGKSFSSN